MAKIFKQKRIYALINRLLIMSIFLNMVFLGGLFNTTTISVNGGKMPVYTSDNFEAGDRHFLFTNASQVNNFALSDIMKMNLKVFVVYYSVGDVLVVLGIFFIITYTMTLFILDVSYLYGAFKRYRKRKLKRKKLRRRVKVAHNVRRKH